MNTTAQLSIKGGVAATGNVTINGQVGFTYAVDGEIPTDHCEYELRADDLGDGAPVAVRAAIEAAGTFDAEQADEGFTLRMICAIAGLPRTLDELRQVPLLIAPFDGPVARASRVYCSDVVLAMVGPGWPAGDLHDGTRQ
jgi:hypothetical protein